MSEVSPEKLNSTEALQRDQYDRISGGYELHYGDEFSQAYRRRFMFEPMTDGLELRGMNAVDAMCGSGESTRHLLNGGARVIGLDISPVEIEKFKARYPECEALQASVLDTGLPDASLDLVCVFGGLHHLHPHVNDAVAEIERVLKPGGYFIFTEPPAGSLPEILRQLWYQFDHLFAENEAGIRLDEMKAAFSEQFDFEVERFGGSFAYLLVLNSMVFRIPHGWKKYYSGLCMTLERWMEPLQGQLFSCSVVCRWRKKK
ncbi:MAG: class I SAM-dependent methyltransferase [Verrucomicrobiota bacterium]